MLAHRPQYFAVVVDLCRVEARTPRVALGWRAVGGWVYAIATDPRVERGRETGPLTFFLDSLQLGPPHPGV